MGECLGWHDHDRQPGSLCKPGGFRQGQGDAEVPRFFQQNPVPRPTDFKVDESKLFVSARTQKVDPGLYVSVTSGKVSVAALGTGESKTIGANQALFTDASGRTVSEVPVPAFQQFDNIPRPNAPNVDTLELGTGVLGDTGGKELICEIK